MLKLKDFFGWYDEALRVCYLRGLEFPSRMFAVYVIHLPRARFGRLMRILARPGYQHIAGSNIGHLHWG
jgi:hypothetical protein